MSDHADQLVGTLFRILSEEGHREARQALLNTYRSRATAERTELTEGLFSELVTVLDEQVDTQTEVDVLATAVERLLDRFSAVVRVAPVAVLVVDDDSRIQVWNDGAERILGWAGAEMRGRTYPHGLTESPETARELCRHLRDGERLQGIEARHAHENGSVLDVRVWAAPLQTDGQGFGGAVFVVSDITRRKQREQRLAVLNRVLRHNIRNDVTIVRGHLDMLADERPADDEHVGTIRERLSNIVELSRAARNIEQLGDEEAERTPVDLGAVLPERVRRLQSQPREITVSSEIPDSLTVVAHELFPYAVDNVLENAVEHNSTDTPRVEVSVESDASRNHVVVAVADNGPGLPPTEQEVLTSQTETPLNHSKGLGLWLTRWIVRSSDGQVSVGESDLGGTRVSLRLPKRTD
ncbi:PAS domain S-box protein [Halosimplex litoreum]|uniref:histidine kinase n=1 Tax=Halosimplex litoreum TaxID=1198301 RepID=A0A7T3FWA3_9EURY|nr:PAS domain S-box protein [Halosimplex litoreum]QPV61939.1 PAS domain S-box protein [Halosimplex litoreum]